MVREKEGLIIWLDIDESQMQMIKVNRKFMQLSVENAILCSVDSYRKSPTEKVGLFAFAILSERMRRLG